MNAINMEGLQKSYDGHDKALDNISLQIQKGEIFGFLGPNGSGKTTTVRILNGILKPTGGYAEILGIPVGKNNLEIHKLCGVMTESSSCYDNLTAKQNLLFFGRMHNVQERVLNERVDYLLKRMDLKDDKDRKVKSFSTGMRKRISLAIAMVHNPKILFLDEPTSGLDPQNVMNVMSLIKGFVLENGVTVFLCTHQLRYAQDLCSLYGFINNGKLLGSGTFDELAAKKNANLEVRIKGHNISNGLGLVLVEREIYKKSVVNKKEVSSLIRDIINSGGEIYEVYQDKWGLEQLYFKYLEETKS